MLLVRTLIFEWKCGLIRYSQPPIYTIATNDLAVLQFPEDTLRTTLRALFKQALPPPGRLSNI